MIRARSYAPRCRPERVETKSMSIDADAEDVVDVKNLPFPGPR